ncbi:MAG: DEAD/DEAH box helicase [Marmoricola sp.]
MGSATGYPELGAFTRTLGFRLDDFQVQACGHLEDGHSVLVAAPTGSGKTVVGEFAVHLALASGRKCFYTTPIKALSNQKYNDLVRRYSAASVGLLTGDNSINSEAPVVVMTTEVLRNMLYAGSPTLAGLRYVVLDEVHYLADRLRGAVWEEVIIHLDQSVLLTALSATVSNAEEFGDWLAQVRGGTTVIVDEHRPVPLWQHMLAGNRLYDLFASAAHKRVVNPELLRVAQRDSWNSGGRYGGGRGGGYRRGGGGGGGGNGRPQRGGFQPARFRPPSRAAVIARLDNAGLLPAITFIFSRAACDAAVAQCLDSGLRLTTPEEGSEIAAIVAERTAGIPDLDLPVLGYDSWLAGLRRGIAAHHAGLLPTFKEVVEELFEAGLVRAVFATETLALGINMPARTVVIEQLSKWNGEAHADLTAGEYTQLTGRAGRRGIDVEGHAVVIWHPGMDPASVAGLAGTRTYPLNSSFQPSYNRAVNLVGQAGRQQAAVLLESSFAQFQADRGVAGVSRQARKLRAELAEAGAPCDRGDITGYARIRRELSDLERGQARDRSAARRAEVVASLAGLRRGDIIQVFGGRRAGVALVLEPAGDGQPMPLVLTENRQVKRLTPADLPAPAQVIERVRIPAAFSHRSPVHRRDLAATLRNKLAGHHLARPPRPPAQSRNGRAGRGAEEAAITRLRAELREHPCHQCPDREAHLRQAERDLRLERDAQALESRVAARSHVLARTFDRVCAVLEELGYIDGDAVTPEGSRLSTLYNELDLVVAECLRRRIWDGLSPAELAACVSALTFESRRPDDASPPRLPGGRVREVLAGMVGLWGDLDAVERSQHLSFLREPDLGFAWAAHAWASGTALERVLGALTPGDFVRAVKQLIDLLDQIAVAAGRGRPAGRDPLVGTARAAINGLRRGVVAYSSVV